MQEKKPLNVAIGRRIQLSRERAGLTQEQLAERISRSTQFISTIERGIAGASLETIISLCETLGVSSEWLLRGREEVPSASLIASKIAALSGEQLALINQLVDDLLALLHTAGAQSHDSPEP